MKNMKYIWIGLGVLTAGALVYYFFFRKKKTTGAAVTLAPASEFDWAALQSKFAGGNPYNADRVLVKAEVSEIGENSPIKYTDFDNRTIDTNYRTRGQITKDQFDQRVLSSIRMQISQKNYDLLKTVKDELNLWWTPVARAGYNDSLERALAYHIRRILAGDFYYTEGGTPTNSSVGMTPVTNNTPTQNPTLTPPPTNSPGGMTAQRYTY